MSKSLRVNYILGLSYHKFFTWLLFDMLFKGCSSAYLHTFKTSGGVHWWLICSHCAVSVVNRCVIYQWNEVNERADKSAPGWLLSPKMLQAFSQHTMSTLESFPPCVFFSAWLWHSWLHSAEKTAVMKWISLAVPLFKLQPWSDTFYLNMVFGSEDSYLD